MTDHGRLCSVSPVELSCCDAERGGTDNYAWDGNTGQILLEHIGLAKISLCKYDALVRMANHTMADGRRLRDCYSKRQPSQTRKIIKPQHMKVFLVAP